VALIAFLKRYHMSSFNSGFDEKRYSMLLGDNKVTDENGFLIALF
jgi:hypothetical protein